MKLGRTGHIGVVKSKNEQTQIAAGRNVQNKSILLHAEKPEQHADRAELLPQK